VRLGTAQAENGGSDRIIPIDTKRVSVSVAKAFSEQRCNGRGAREGLGESV
jgi:hypothetical protein